MEKVNSNSSDLMAPLVVVVKTYTHCCYNADKTSLFASLKASEQSSIFDV